MQYHFDGFRSGDPDIAQEARSQPTPDDAVDVLIVGCGPAGLTLAAQLSAFPEVKTRIIDQKPGPLEIGQADGIACRSMEMFAAFGFAEKVAREAYWVNETVFWRPGKEGKGLHRADRIQDVEDDLSEMPHVILSQARVHDFFLEVMQKSPTRITPVYNCALKDVTRTEDAHYPVTATLTDLGLDQEFQIRAKYLVGCDGARSQVRTTLGYALKGEAARQLWGVMDVLAVTDFPDIRLKSAIQSADAGSLLIIPREGGAMVRMYIELGALNEGERAGDQAVTAERMISRAQDILAPYTLDVKEVPWCSAYEIGQRVCDSFDDLGSARDGHAAPRVFIAGDACHTHSPKAGQGMNVSMADTFNLGWKLAAVLRGEANPNLLKTYSEERQAKARELIEFDRDMARLFSSRSTDGASDRKFQAYFQKHGRYTAGVETRYEPSLIVGDGVHQDLATGLMVGKRFHSAPVIRLADAKPMQLGHAFPADGRWRLVAFASQDDQGQDGGAVSNLCAYLATAPSSPIQQYTQVGQDTDAVIDLRVVFQTYHRDLQIETMPEILLSRKGKLGLTDYEKIFCPDQRPGSDIFDLREINREKGAMVLLRPDQFVADVLPLDGFKALETFFAAFMVPRSG